MKDLPDSSVDLVLCDPPYGTTDCTWDHVLPFDKLWKEYRRVLKPTGTAVLFAAQPFTTRLISSNMADFRYCWYWKKNNVTGAMFAKVQPMRCIEDVAVFYMSPSGNNEGKYKALRAYMHGQLAASGMSRQDVNRLLGNSMSSHYFTYGQQFAIPSAENWAKLQSTGYFQRSYDEIRAEWEAEAGGPPGQQRTYNPQGLIELEKPIHKKKVDTSGVYGAYTGTPQPQRFTNYPKHLLEFANEAASNKNRLHPTQKPVALLEYLVRTYTNPGETVLDNCMGSGSTGVACINAGRRFIGMEQDVGYFVTAANRIEEAYHGRHQEEDPAVFQGQ